MMACRPTSTPPRELLTDREEGISIEQWGREELGGGERRGYWM
jgi:hypothetical protein